MSLRFERALLIALAAFGALLFAGTYAIEVSFSSGSDLGPQFVPRIFAAALIVCSLIALVTAKHEEDHHVHVDAVVGLVMLIAIAYALALPVLGYVISTFATLTLVLLAVRAGSWWRVLLFAAGMTGGLYVIFERVMLVGLPAGPFMR